MMNCDDNGEHHVSMKLEAALKGLGSLAASICFLKPQQEEEGRSVDWWLNEKMPPP